MKYVIYKTEQKKLTTAATLIRIPGELDSSVAADVQLLWFAMLRKAEMLNTKRR